MKNIQNFNQIKERILQFINYKNVSIRKFSEKIDINPSNFGKSNLKSDLSSQVLSKILIIFPEISAEWLLTGKGDMLKNSMNTPQNDNKEAINTLSDIRIPVYNIDVRAGMHDSTDITPDDAQYIERYTLFDGAKKGDIAFHVTGQSMIPKYLPGSLVLVREVASWQEYFGYGDCYILMLNDGRRVLKQVMKSQQDAKQYVLCQSINPQYPAEELPRKMILKVFKVIACQTFETF